MLNLIVTWLTKIKQNYDYYADPRAKEMFLVPCPIPLLIILVSYLYFCIKAGPAFMKDRKPYQLHNVLIAYNAIQVLISCYLAFEGAKIFTHCNLLCEPLEESWRPALAKGAFLCWAYYMAKITELLDTVFFVLRKKFSQITFLHLFHHTVMPLVSWFGILFFAGVHGTMFGVVNSFVHIFMYSYYFIASLGPQYQKYLWWKRHLTELQLIQFVIVFIHNFIPLFTSCTYPKILNLFGLLMSSTFICMFGSFYIKAYMTKNKSSKTDEIKNVKMKNY